MVEIFKSKIVSALVIALLLVSTLFVTPGSAQETGGGSGVSLSPTRTEISILPGLQDEITISVKNVTNIDIIAKPAVNDFEPNGETGDPRLLFAEQEESARSIRDFIGEMEDIPLAPGESKDVVIPVRIPEEAFPGGYYGAIRYQAVPQTDDVDGNGQISLTASVASLVLIEVPGDIEERVTVDFVKTYIDDKEGSVFTKKPNFAGVSITNDGDSFIKPFGTVRITDFRGSEVFSYQLNDLSPRGNVLPETTRLFKDRIVNIESKTVNGEEEITETQPIKWPGRYKITADVSYGNGGEVYTVSSSFWYIPVWMIIVLLGLLVVLIGGVIFMYRKYITKSTRRK